MDWIPEAISAVNETLKIVGGGGAVVMALMLIIGAVSVPLGASLLIKLSVSSNAGLSKALDELKESHDKLQRQLSVTEARLAASDRENAANAREIISLRDQLGRTLSEITLLRQANEDLRRQLDHGKMMAADNERLLRSKVDEQAITIETLRRRVRELISIMKQHNIAVPQEDNSA